MCFKDFKRLCEAMKTHWFEISTANQNWTLSFYVSFSTQSLTFRIHFQPTQITFIPFLTLFNLTMQAAIINLQNWRAILKAIEGQKLKASIWFWLSHFHVIFILIDSLLISLPPAHKQVFSFNAENLFS